MEQRGFGGKLLRVVRGLGIVVGSFFVTLVVLDILALQLKLSRQAPSGLRKPHTGPIAEEASRLGMRRYRWPGVATGASHANLGRGTGGSGVWLRKGFFCAFKCQQEKPAHNQRVAGEANRSTVRLNCGKPAHAARRPSFTALPVPNGRPGARQTERQSSPA